MDRVVPSGQTILSVGIDAADIERVERFLSDHPARLEQVFTAGERAYCEAGAGRRRGARYAAAFSAKEAVMKALGTGWRSDVDWSEIDTASRRADGGVLLSGGAREIAERHGVARILISVATTAETTMAMAVADRHE
jgi:holo-[acyl-carrier protein] synthase